MQRGGLRSRAHVLGCREFVMRRKAWLQTLTIQLNFEYHLKSIDKELQPASAYVQSSEQVRIKAVGEPYRARELSVRSARSWRRHERGATAMA